MPIGEILAQIGISDRTVEACTRGAECGAAPAPKKTVGRPKKAAPASKKEAAAARVATKLEKKKKKRTSLPRGENGLPMPPKALGSTEGCSGK